MSKKIEKNRDREGKKKTNESRLVIFVEEESRIERSIKSKRNRKIKADL